MRDREWGNGRYESSSLCSLLHCDRAFVSSKMCSSMRPKEHTNISMCYPHRHIYNSIAEVMAFLVREPKGGLTPGLMRRMVKMREEERKKERKGGQ